MAPANTELTSPRARPTESDRRHWAALSALAARDLPPGRIGGVIAQLRQRGRVANRRASVFLGFLLATVMLGLGYYIGLPFWRAFSDGTIRTWQDQVFAAEMENAALDSRRAAAVARLVDALELAPEVARSGQGEGFSDPLTVAESTILATGWDGTILRSTNRGATWTEVRAGSERSEEFSTPLALFDGTLIAVGAAGTILRSTDGGATWPEVRAQQGESFNIPLAMAGGTLVATGSSGTILRSTDGGATWPEVRARPEQGDGFSFAQLVLAGDALIAAGSSGTILRSIDSGATWSEMRARSGETLNTPLVLADGTLLVTGWFGTILRSTDGGVTWAEARTRSATGDRYYAPLALADGTLLAASDHGAILRSTDSGATWSERRGRRSDLYDAPLAIADGTLLAMGRSGSILRSTDVGAIWREVRAQSEPSEYLAAPLTLADGTLIVVGWEGTILRSTDSGATWLEARARPGTGEGFRSSSLAVADDVLIAAGHAGSIMRSTDGGATWLKLRELSGEGISSLRTLTDGTMVAIGWSGTILRLSRDTAGRLETLAAHLPPGGAGDARLAEFQAGLDPQVRIAEAVVDAFRPLDRIAAERGPVEAGLARATERLAAWRSGEAAPEVRLAAFASFMESCRAGSTEPQAAALTTACLDAFSASEADAQRQWWQALAEEVPTGILLLFLLATLSGLYRYNVRLAGFHHGRADALELVVAEVPKDLLTPVADALAADKVEFGAAKTPTDHAAEMATALLNRVKP